MGDEEGCSVGECFSTVLLKKNNKPTKSKDGLGCLSHIWDPYMGTGLEKTYMLLYPQWELDGEQL